MWNRSVSRQPIASFPLPPSPPDDVAAADAEYNRLGDVWGALRGDLDDAKAALASADRESIRAAADAYAAGKEPRDPEKARRAAEAKVGVLQTKIAAAAVAVHEAGNELADAVVAHRAEWLELLAAEEADAAEAYDRAIADARRALTVLGPARRAVGWLQELDAGRAHAGQEPAFSGGRVRVDTTSIRRETLGNPTELLDALAQATAEPTPRRQRGLKRAAPRGPKVAA